jgi:probable phosphoglycerate mutase
VDVPLSEQGERDCAKAAGAMARLHVDVVVTSTMARAIETARSLGYDPSRFVRSSLCNERRYGVLEGRTWREVQALEPPVLFIEVGGERHSVNPAGGEPFEDVWQRAKEFRREVLDRYADRTTLVVSHGVFLQMLHGVLRGSNCIESLAKYPSSLELSTFRLSDGHLVEESGSKLLGVAGEGF